MNKVCLYVFFFAVVVTGCSSNDYTYNPPVSISELFSRSTKKVTDPCVGISECILSYIDYDECMPQPYWDCCPTRPVAHSVTGGIGFVNNSGGAKVLMRGDTADNGCYKFIDLNGMFHISIAEQDTQLISNDTVIIESHLYRNGQEIDISPIYRVQSNMNTMATIESNSITKDNYVIYCKDDTITANILVDYGIISHTESSGPIRFNSKTSYKLVVYMRDLHDIPTNESCTPPMPTTLEDFEQLKYESVDCHLADHIMIISIPLCGTVYKPEHIKIPVHNH